MSLACIPMRDPRTGPADRRLHSPSILTHRHDVTSAYLYAAEQATRLQSTAGEEPFWHGLDHISD